MQKVVFNVNNPVINKNVDEVKEISEYDFWYIYLSLLNIKKPVLSDRELSVMTYILSGDPNTSYFRGDARNKLISDIGVKSPNLSLYLDSLLAKGYLTFQGTRGDYLVSNNLRKFQLFIKSNIEAGLDLSYVFTLPFKIVSESDGN
jgi:hypothetical protein